MNLRQLIAAGTFAAAPFVLAACAGGPAPPDWQASAHGSLNAFTSAYLTGNNRVADAEFARARSELTRTGQAGLVARAELIRCGVQVASLIFDGCPGYAALAQDANASERAYAAFLDNQPADSAQLPLQYRSLASGSLHTIEAPLSRLIAAGVLFNAGKLHPDDIQMAVDTASAAGWRRPLLAWLGVQEKLAISTVQSALAASARRRIELVGGGAEY